MKAMIAGIWLLSLAHGVFFILCTPLWEGYDEPFHYAYIQHLSERGQIPVYGRTLVSKEITASFRVLPLSPVVNRNLGGRYTAFSDYWKLPKGVLIERQNALRSIPRSDRRVPDESSAAVLSYEAQQPPLYYFLAAGVYRLFSGRDPPTLVLVLRLFSLLIGSLTIPLAYSVAREVFHSPGGRLCPSLLIALLPAFFSTVGRVSNDCLAVTLFGLLMLLTLRYLISGCRLGPALQIGLVAGLGLLTKVYFLTALPAIAVVFVAAGIRHKSVRQALVRLVWVLVPVLVVAGWWHARNLSLYGNLSGMFMSTIAPPMSILDRMRAAAQVPWLQGFNTLFREHLWTENSSFGSLSKTTYLVGYILVALGTLGLIRSFGTSIRARGVRPGDGQSAASTSAVGVLAAYYAFFGLGIAYQVLQSFILSRQPGVTGGWYLYAMVVPETVLLTYGLQFLIRPKLQPLGPVILVTCAVILSFLGDFCKTIPYYAGVFIPRFHLQDFFAVYSPANFALMMQNLAINKPEFVSPFQLGTFVLVYPATLIIILLFWFRASIPAQSRPESR